VYVCVCACVHASVRMCVCGAYWISKCLVLLSGVGLWVPRSLSVRPSRQSSNLLMLDFPHKTQVPE